MVPSWPRCRAELLLVSKWLKPHESDNKRAITEALDAFARAAIKNRLQTRGMFRAIF
jgi:hypothetical protein